MSYSVASTKKESLAPIYTKAPYRMGLPRWLSGKESACNAGDPGDMGSIPGSGRSPGGGNGNPLQYSCLENPMDRGAWRATVHEVAKSQTKLKQLSTHARMHAKSILSCLTLCDPMDCSPPGFSVPGILQARILEWVAIFSSRGYSQPRD